MMCFELYFEQCELYKIPIQDVSMEIILYNRNFALKICLFI